MMNTTADREALDFRLEMIREAYEVHDLDSETGEVCCSADNPCRTRWALQQVEAQTLEQIPAPHRQTAQTSEEVRPGSSGSQVRTRRVADPASEAQIRFINKLAGEIDPTDLESRHAKNLDRVRTGQEISKRVASALITAMKSAPKIRTAQADLATEAQISFLRTLVSEQTEIPADLTKKDASDLIEALKSRPRRTEAQTPAEIEDGMYQTPDGEIYKVQAALHGSGRKYAKKLVALDAPRELKNGTRTHEFAYESGAIRKLTPEMRMTLEQAKAFGALYGTCCRCGITLTDEKSIERGMGKHCAAKM